MCIFLFFIQLYKATSSQINPDILGLSHGSPLLTSLKDCVVRLAGNSGVLSSVQYAAQSVLRCGWNILLSTVSERASALSELLPSGEGSYKIRICLAN